MPIHYPYNKDHKVRARELRSEMTPEEQIIWRLVRRKQIHGVTFHRQKPIDQYVVDFYCPKAKLVVEIDGGQHFEPDHAESDRLRDEALQALGLQTIRFSNSDVRRRIAAVGDEIYRVVGKRLRRPADSSLGDP